MQQSHFEIRLKETSNNVCNSRHQFECHADYLPDPHDAGWGRMNTILIHNRTIIQSVPVLNHDQENNAITIALPDNGKKSNLWKFQIQCWNVQFHT